MLSAVIVPPDMSLPMPICCELDAVRFSWPKMLMLAQTYRSFVAGSYASRGQFIEPPAPGDHTKYAAFVDGAYGHVGTSCVPLGAFGKPGMIVAASAAVTQCGIRLPAPPTGSGCVGQLWLRAAPWPLFRFGTWTSGTLKFGTVPPFSAFSTYR